MFDLRRPVKIFIKDNKVSFGMQAEPGSFPVFSVDSMQDAEGLIRDHNLQRDESVVSYARRLAGVYNKGGEQFAPGTSAKNMQQAQLQPNLIANAALKG